MEPVVVILGAAVSADGSASAPMRRRVQGALDVAAMLDRPVFLPSGGIGRYGPSEASVMAGLLEAAGVPRERIICEEHSASTAASVLNCAALIAHRFPHAAVFICTDAYHRPRAAWLFRLLGVRVKTPPVPGGVSEIYLRRWIYYWVRELFAIPVDTLLVCAHRWWGVQFKR